MNARIKVMTSFEIKWQAPEYEYREKTVSWYWISIVVAALVIAFSVWQKNFLFGFFIVIAEMLFIVWGNRTPDGQLHAERNGHPGGRRKASSA